MRLLKLGWVGTRPEQAETMAAFVRDILGLPLCDIDQDQWVFQLPDGSKMEVFGASQNPHLPTTPEVEFFTDDLATAAQELRASGTPILLGPVFTGDEDGAGWLHFRAPDGNIYGITQGRDLEAGPGGRHR